MSLQLRQIRLKNWKCYQKQQLRLNPQINCNVWIIFGQNGYGKTSILEAILWCLYGNEGVPTKDLSKYFNRVAVKKNPSLDMCVELSFHETTQSRNYYISRTAKRVIRGNTEYAEVEEATFNIDGTSKNNAREYIESLLPRLCKDFFFFDGVKIEQYAVLTQTDETKDAIEKILGIPELRNLKEDAEKVLQSLEKKIRELGQANHKLQQNTKQLQEIQVNIELHCGQLEHAKQTLEVDVKIYNDAKERAKQIEDLRSKLETVARLEQRQEILKDKLKNAEKEVENALKKASMPLLIGFVREMVEELQRQTIKTTRFSASLIQLQELLNSKNCLCGRCLDESSRNYIREQLTQIEAGKLTQEAIKQDELKTRLSLLLQYHKPNLEDILTTRDRLGEDLDNLKQEITRYKHETEGTNQQEAAEIWRKVGISERKVQETREITERLTKDIEELKNQEKKLRQTIETLAGQDKETATLSLQVRLATGLKAAAEELINWHIHQSKRTIEEHTTARYLQVTNKPEEYTGIEIKNNYTLGVRTVTGDILNPEILSPGEKEALAFAFITGLNLASNTAAPLVMDTPFGHLDTAHQKNIVKSLGQMSSQVILLATDRDFPDPLLQEIKPYLAEIHYIRRKNASEDASIIES
ncbi:AAA family ATPase [Chroococcus sp. FPU101]|uniref:AAA family ATPase n=1 Tax=Chroococcus sp. FPU101 TaxID=1974212 RepID=UPI001A8CA6D2|nr:AAA family ATPase [Chroococcus sp. FPU101]GFE68476.1 unknown protein [Chroococcus sp. FPU101]